MKAPAPPFTMLILWKISLGYNLSKKYNTAQRFFFFPFSSNYPIGPTVISLSFEVKKHVENESKITSYTKALSLYENDFHIFPFKNSTQMLKLFTFRFLTLLLLGAVGGQDLISVPSSSFSKKRREVATAEQYSLSTRKGRRGCLLSILFILCSSKSSQLIRFHGYCYCNICLFEVQR